MKKLTSFFLSLDWLSFGPTFFENDKKIFIKSGFIQKFFSLFSKDNNILKKRKIGHHFKKKAFLFKDFEVIQFKEILSLNYTFNDSPIGILGTDYSFIP